MVVDVALYMVVHQPRRLKLPAQPIPRCASIEDITHCLFDERLNERYFRQVAQACYYPAAHMLLKMVRQQGMRLALGFSLSFTRQAALWEPELLDLFRELAEEESLEIIGVDPYHSLHCLLDLPGFVMRMHWMAEEIEQIFGKRPMITDTSGQGMSTSLYAALDTAGFRGALMESSPQVLQWRSSNYLYHSNAEAPCAAEIKLTNRARRSTARISERDRLGPPYTAEEVGENAPYLLTRHTGLSADISTRFSSLAWSGSPLYADVYARWIAAAEGDYVVLGLDMENFGERHAHSSGIFEFMQALPRELEQLGVTARTPSELIERFSAQRAYHLPLPLHTTTWASSSNAGLYFAHEEQRALFQRMHDVYNFARLTENPDLLDLAIWLTQTDLLRLVQWPGPHIETSITPQEWWHLGPSGILHEQGQIYLNLLHAFEPYLPARILRQGKRKGSVKPPRRKSAPVKQEVKVGAPARSNKLKADSYISSIPG